MKRLTKQESQRMRCRHRRYAWLLMIEALLIATLPLSLFFPTLLSIELVVLALVVIRGVAPYSLLRGADRKLLYCLGSSVVFVEVAWNLSFLAEEIPLVRWSAPVRLILWLFFIGLTEFRLVRALSREPFVTVRVVMGAVAGYLLIGVGGGILLNSIWVLHPLAFDVETMQSALDHSNPSLYFAPALMASSFAMLTTVGTNVVTTDLVGRVSEVVISLVGQLYIALLIALILGRYHRRVS